MSGGERKVDLETLFAGELGHFGWFQARFLLLGSALVVFAAWGANEYVFTTGRINSRCRIPECDGLDRQWAPAWLDRAIPAGDNCQRYGNSSAMGIVYDTCPPELFDQNVLLPCEGYIYENSNTVVYDFNLGCDEWRRSLIGSVTTLGTLCSLPITGYVSDRWGRRVALVLNAVNLAWLGVIRYWADTYIGFVLSEFFAVTFGGGIISTVHILSMELVGPKYRLAASATWCSFFAIGSMLLGLIAWGVPNWRMLTLALFSPMFISLGYYWLMPESVRWYMSKGRYDESEAMIKYIAKMNGKQISGKSLEDLRYTAQENKKQQALDEMQRENEPTLIVLVFQHKKILLRCIVSPVWWISAIFIYYGMSINSVNLSGNRYLNYAASAAVEIPGFWMSILLMGWIGRRPLIMVSYWICAACQFAYIFIPNDQSGAMLAVFLVGKFSIAMVVQALYVYTSELYPTKYRHQLFAFSSMMGRVGAIVAPLTPAFAAETFPELPFVLFGGFALASGLLMLLTPETLGTRLPDTMEEAENLGRSPKN